MKNPIFDRQFSIRPHEHEHTIRDIILIHYIADGYSAHQAQELTDCLIDAALLADKTR